jgi:hypothetical protein
MMLFCGDPLFLIREASTSPHRQECGGWNELAPWDLAQAQGFSVLQSPDSSRAGDAWLFPICPTRWSVAARKNHRRIRPLRPASLDDHVVPGLRPVCTVHTVSGVTEFPGDASPWRFDIEDVWSRCSASARLGPFSVSLLHAREAFMHLTRPSLLSCSIPQSREHHRLGTQR